MNKELKNLPSEQIPNDGGWHWNRLIQEANDRLGKIGKHGKRAKIKVIPRPGKPISAQFSLNRQQKQYGLDLSLNRNNLVKAEEICSLITGQLVAETFTEDWFYSLIGKNKNISISNDKKKLNCGEMLEQYKTHYFKQRKDNKNPDGSWYISYRYTESALAQYTNKIIDLHIIKEIVEKTPNNSRTRVLLLNGLASFLKYFNNNEFKQIIKQYKDENNPKPRHQYIPDDGEILDIYKFGFKPNINCVKKWRYRYPQWQFLYALLATYGLRVHEAWNIKNWDTPVILKNGDWVMIDDDRVQNADNKKENFIRQQLRQDLIIPAILDPSNQDYLLCIGHETKTGYRVAFPISPSGHSRNCTWIKEFNLIQPLNLPDIVNPLEFCNKKATGKKCSARTAFWFSSHIYGFTPHALRHAYNHRGHNLGINQKMLADSLGHSLLMNGTIYSKHEKTSSKIQNIKRAIHNDTYKHSELEKLLEENKHLKTEIEKLKAELAMYKAIEQSKRN